MVVEFISVVVEEFEDEVTKLVDEEPDEQADNARVKSVIIPITRQKPYKRIDLIFIVPCPLFFD